MKNDRFLVLCTLCLLVVLPALGQDSTNCFLWDYAPKAATVPTRYVDTLQTAVSPNIVVKINAADTLAKVSKYIFGNAVAVWVPENVNTPVLVDHLKKLSPTLLRYPGGSWSDVFFWNTNPGDLPAMIPDGVNGGVPAPLGPHSGQSVSINPASYYDLRNSLGSQGLITVNYGYARYGLGAKPAERAAHYAADWVRSDNGRTKFWEIGNENGGPWEAGWMIDTTVNKDGQPQIISGALYGQHFKVFADSMRAAAAEIGATIYIGAQILHFDGTNDWDVANHTWNAGVFSALGDAADFYVMHNYFGGGYLTLRNQVESARMTINSNIAFIQSDIASKHASPKPVALTEWNCNGPDTAKVSIANGMQAVMLSCEMMRTGFGMSARWPVVNWDKDGMFYFLDGNPTTIPKWNPRPDFYYLYYLQQFTGDHMLSSVVTGSSDIHCWATTFSNGYVGVVLMNQSSINLTVRLTPQNMGVGSRFYVYTLTGVGAGEFPEAVAVNGFGPTGAAWGPLDSLENVPAMAFPITNQIRISSPARAVEFVLLEPGQNTLSVGESDVEGLAQRFELLQNYPNPFNPRTMIRFTLPRTSRVTLRVYDLLGREIATLVDRESLAAGTHDVSFDASHLSSGVYFYRLQADGIARTRQMVLVK